MRTVTRVFYPGLETHPQHALARAQMHDFGSIVSFDIRGGAESGGRFADAVRLFARAASLGSTESLVMPPQLLRNRDLSAAQAALASVSDSTVRLSVGIEDPEDLIADLRQALALS